VPTARPLDGALNGRLGSAVRVSSLPAIFGMLCAATAMVETALHEYPDRFFVTWRDIVIRNASCQNYSVAWKQASEESKFGLMAQTRPTIRPPNYQPSSSLRRPSLAGAGAHLGAELDQLQPAIEKFPDVTWLLAHTASSRKKNIFTLQLYPNVYLELCYSPCPRG